MRDAQHLTVRSERPQLGANHISDPTADPRVDLVEHERSALAFAKRHRLQRQHHPR
jgi:hypothetical protein